MRAIAVSLATFHRTAQETGPANVAEQSHRSQIPTARIRLPREPNERIEPMHRLQHDQHPIGEEVTAFDMRQLVQKNVAQFAIGECLAKFRAARVIEGG